MFTTLTKQVYLDQPYVPSEIHLPVNIDDREILEDLLSEKRGRKVEILPPQRRQKRALLGLVAKNARHSFERRFRTLIPQAREMMEGLADALDLPKLPVRIECFDVSHIQGTNIVASMVVWAEGRMKKSDYRKFIVRTVPSNDDFASMREVVTRRYRRLQEEEKPLPDLVLVDGGIGQLHAAAQALEELQIINQPLASIAKKEEVLYIYGPANEPVVLDHHSPVLHLIQQIRDEAHRFAVTFHRARRESRSLTTELTKIPGVGERTAKKLLSHFGSLSRIKSSTTEELAQVVPSRVAAAISRHLGEAAHRNVY